MSNLASGFTASRIGRLLSRSGSQSDRVTKRSSLSLRPSARAVDSPLPPGMIRPPVMYVAPWSNQNALPMHTRQVMHRHRQLERLQQELYAEKQLGIRANSADPVENSGGGDGGGQETATGMTGADNSGSQQGSPTIANPSVSKSLSQLDSWRLLLALRLTLAVLVAVNVAALLLLVVDGLAHPATILESRTQYCKVMGALVAVIVTFAVLGLVLQSTVTMQLGLRLGTALSLLQLALCGAGCVAFNTGEWSSNQCTFDMRFVSPWWAVQICVFVFTLHRYRRLRQLSNDALVIRILYYIVGAQVVVVLVQTIILALTVPNGFLIVRIASVVLRLTVICLSIFVLRHSLHHTSARRIRQLAEKLPRKRGARERYVATDDQVDDLEAKPQMDTGRSGKTLDRRTATVAPLDLPRSRTYTGDQGKKAIKVREAVYTNTPGASKRRSLKATPSRRMNMLLVEEEHKEGPQEGSPQPEDGNGNGNGDDGASVSRRPTREGRSSRSTAEMLQQIDTMEDLAIINN